MKVIHVIPSISELHGGPTTVLHRMTRALADYGISVDVVCTDDNGPGLLQVPLGEPVLTDGVRIFYFHRQLAFYMVSWPLVTWLYRHLRSYDLVHIHAVFSFSSVAAAFLAHCLGVPYIIRPLGTLNQWGLLNRRPLLKKFSLAMIERPLLRRARAIHVTSVQERDEVAIVYSGANGVIIPDFMKKSVIIPEPVRRSWNMAGHRVPRQEDRRSNVVLFLSRIDRVKGLDLLLRGFRLVLREFSDCRLIVAGTGDPKLTEELKDLARALRIENSVTWRGFVSGAEKWLLLASANAFVLPSRSENFGVAVLEALSAGVPVVVSNRVALHREIAASNAGLVTKCDPDDIAYAIIRLLKDPETATRFAANGKALVETQFSEESVLKRVLALYEYCLHGYRTTDQSQGPRRSAAKILRVVEEDTWSSSGRTEPENRSQPSKRAKGIVNER
jgi:glycosyltransferase involved in cell wall biosynthesis